jgi:hypothetical protein
MFVSNFQIRTCIVLEVVQETAVHCIGGGYARSRRYIRPQRHSGRGRSFAPNRHHLPFGNAPCCCLFVHNSKLVSLGYISLHQSSHLAAGSDIRLRGLRSQSHHSSLRTRTHSHSSHRPRTPAATSLRHRTQLHLIPLTSSVTSVLHYNYFYRHLPFW